MLSRYRILSPLGAGGMGEVYLAFDESLERNVALKVLPRLSVRDPELIRRFVQEAKAASSLNHPNIVTIHEVGNVVEGDETLHFIAMEFVRGRTLREKLREKVPLAKLLEWVAQCADALTKAHAAGVVHRDLKPENIMVTDDGLVKIVDFGLAKLIQSGSAPPGGMSDISTAHQHTREGAVLGTVGYMAPEQVRAGPIDHRADIFSLGCILYEVVAGSRAFSGSSQIEVLHMILNAEPAAVARLNPAVSPDLERIVERSLAKDPDERYQSAREISIELRRALRSGVSRPLRREERSRARRLPLLLGASALVVAAVIVGSTIAFRGPEELDLTNYRFTPVETTPDYEGSAAWSPDGRSIAYVKNVGGVLQVFTRSLDASVPTQITTAVADCRTPFWSPDGQRIYYVSLAQEGDALWSVNTAAGTSEVVLPNVNSAAISPDGKTFALLRDREQGDFAMSLWMMVPPAEPLRYTNPAFDTRPISAGFLRFSPDGKKLGAWVSLLVGGAPTNFWEIPLDGSAPRRQATWGSKFPRPQPFAWMPDSRRVVFASERRLGFADTHLWIANTESGEFRSITASHASQAYPTVSPDGKRIVFSSEDFDFDLIEIPLGAGVPGAMLATSRAERDPVWSPSKPEYAFVSNRSGLEEIWLRSADGTWERPIARPPDFSTESVASFSSLSFSPDGRRIAFQASAEAAEARIRIVNIAGGTPVPLTRMRPYLEDHPSWSPDGKWIAFTSSGGGGRTDLVKVRPGGDGEVRLLAGTLLVNTPLSWSPRGDVILCETLEGMTLVSSDGREQRILTEETWLAHEWSTDGSKIFALKVGESLDIVLIVFDPGDGREEVLQSLGPVPPMNHPVYGLSLAPDGRSLATSVAKLRGDLWLLEGFAPEENSDRQ